MLKQMLVCSLSALLLAGCSSEEAVPKKVVKPTELPLTLELDESQKPSDSIKNEVVYKMSGQSKSPLYLTGTEYLPSGKQKIWFSETIKPGQYDGEKLKLGQLFDTTKGYRSYTYELDGTMHDWSIESDDLKDFLINGVSFREKSLRQSNYQVLMLEQSSIRSTMLGNEMNDVQTPQSVKLKKGESIFTISLSTTPVGGSSGNTL